MKIVLDVSNLSIHAKKFIRTGIQEVVFRTLQAIAGLRSEYPKHEIVLLPKLPKRCGTDLQGETPYPYEATPKFVFSQLENEFGLSSRALWGFDFQSCGYELSDEAAMDFIADADVVHFQGLVNVGPYRQALKNCGNNRTLLSMTIYDLVPVLYPEYCDDGIARWYRNEYLPRGVQCLDQAICISRNTALDFAQGVGSNPIRISIIPLPSNIVSNAKGVSRNLRKVTGDKYIVFLGSLEPRKNFDAVLSGFELYLRCHPHSNLRLVMIGGTGWKNSQIERRLAASPAALHITRTGYLSDVELEAVMRRASGVIMLAHYEGYGLPVAQAFSAGVPAVTTLGSSLPEACSGQGIFVDPTDEWSVSAGISLALSRNMAPVVRNDRNWRAYSKLLLDSLVTLNAQIVSS